LAVCAFSFLLFGISALLVSALILPLVAVLSRDPLVRRTRTRRVLRGGMRAFVAVMSGLRGLSYEFRGVERLGRPGQLVVANHPSLIDVLFLLAFTPDAGCIVKQAMRTSMLTRNAVNAAGYISNDPTYTMVEEATAALTQGQCLIMFPEGTRTTPGEPLMFHRGAANFAVRSARVLTPVYIRCEPTTLTKADRWYRITPQRVHFTLEVGDDIDLDEYRNMRSIPLASRALNERLRDNFESKLRRLDEIY
jgi:1-acyl-sn-glycerol-3-phosphate acyltransferase